MVVGISVGLGRVPALRRRQHKKWLWADARGVTALEFAILAPVFLTFLFAILGVGLDGFYQLNLDDAVRDVARQVQIGEPASQSGPKFAAAVCAELLITSGCTTRLTYNVQTNASTAAFASLQPLPMPSSGQLPNLFQPCSANNNILVQVAIPLPITFPLLGSAITLTGTNSMMAITTIRAEPYS